MSGAWTVEECGRNRRPGELLHIPPSRVEKPGFTPRPGRLAHTVARQPVRACQRPQSTPSTSPTGTIFFQLNNKDWLRRLAERAPAILSVEVPLKPLRDLARSSEAPTWPDLNFHPSGRIAMELTIQQGDLATRWAKRSGRCRRRAVPLPSCPLVEARLVPPSPGAIST
jgi:hypothetical protein